MNYELLSVVIQSAKDIVAGKGTDEDESDIQEWGAEAIVTLDKNLGDMEYHLRELASIFQYMTVSNPLAPVALINEVWWKVRDYLEGLEG